MLDVVKENLSQSNAALEGLMSDLDKQRQISDIGGFLASSLQSGGKILSCGNGGSMCDAMHFAEELTGRFRDDRPGMAAIAISDPSHMSCVGNDFGYEKIFSRYVEAVGKKDDVLLAISTSGSSKNVVAAAIAAKHIGMKVVGLSGKPNTELEKNSDYYLWLDGKTAYADRVQELHIKILHTWIDIIERSNG
jgi:D-sedoheptulose 7-phosphate isomerase